MKKIRFVCIHNPCVTCDGSGAVNAYGSVGTLQVRAHCLAVPSLLRIGRTRYVRSPDGIFEFMRRCILLNIVMTCDDDNRKTHVRMSISHSNRYIISIGRCLRRLSMTHVYVGP